MLTVQYAASEMTNRSFILFHISEIDGKGLFICIPKYEQLDVPARSLHLRESSADTPEKYFPSWCQQGSSLAPYDDHRNKEYFQEFHSLAATTLTE